MARLPLVDGEVPPDDPPPEELPLVGEVELDWSPQPDNPINAAHQQQSSSCCVLRISHLQFGCCDHGHFSAASAPRQTVSRLRPSRASTLPSNQTHAADRRFRARHNASGARTAALHSQDKKVPAMLGCNRTSARGNTIGSPEACLARVDGGIRPWNLISATLNFRPPRPADRVIAFPRSERTRKLRGRA